MWSKSEMRSPAEPLASPASRPAMPAAPIPVTPSSMEGSVPNMPIRGRMEPETRGSATIGKAVKIVGQIYSREDLFVDGDLEGTVEALEQKVTVGPNGDGSRRCQGPGCGGAGQHSRRCGSDRLDRDPQGRQTGGQP